jgi:hypothetical protein
MKTHLHHLTVTSIASTSASTSTSTSATATVTPPLPPLPLVAAGRQTAAVRLGAWVGGWVVGEDRRSCGDG